MGGAKTFWIRLYCMTRARKPMQNYHLLQPVVWVGIAITASICFFMCLTSLLHTEMKNQDLDFRPLFAATLSPDRGWANGATSLEQDKNIGEGELRKISNALAHG